MNHCGLEMLLKPFADEQIKASAIGSIMFWANSPFSDKQF